MRFFATFIISTVVLFGGPLIVSSLGMDGGNVSNEVFAALHPIDSNSSGGSRDNSAVDGSRDNSQSSGNSGGSSFENPLKFEKISDFLAALIDILIIFAIPIIVFFIMYAGFLYVTAAGNMEQVKKAHSSFLWALIGGVIVLGAKMLIVVIQGTVNGFRA